MQLNKNINARINNLLHYSFYIRAGKEQIYIKCFENDSWLQCSSSVGVDEKSRIQRIKILKSSEKRQPAFSNKPVVKTINPFDHPRLVYNQYEHAEALIRFLLRYLMELPKSSRWKMAGYIIFQLDYEPEGGITDVEKKMIKESLEQSSAKLGLVAKPSTVVSEDKIEKLYTYIVENRISKEDQIEQELQEMLI